ncbi:DoxX family protein [Pontibacillus sp. HMF3514]|uniref:DoxX family protein n=1 Tax=Pontibacillus sp. HMF3514 TaxID=2692425 RepID=UPI00131F5F1B|nr:DoxX family protein [Pontibacillus sp. HMF3514]QHE51982.1 DoxX family membrane protein [Pontibacillus sp. HMF3514]
MFNTFLRNNQVVGIILTFLRIYLGYTWFTAGWSKLTGDGFNASGYLKGAIGKATGEHPAVQGWWASFLENVALPNSELFSFLVMWGEILVGIALILGIFTTFATLMGLTMNFAFLFSGTVSTNPQMVIIGTILLVAGYNAAKFGLDRWVLPLMKKPFPTREQKNEKYV